MMRQDKHYGSQSSRARKLAKTFVPGSERAEPFCICSRERKFQGTKWPGSEWAGSELTRERIGQGPIGRFASGSEWTREQKGSIPNIHITIFYPQTRCSRRWQTNFHPWSRHPAALNQMTLADIRVQRPGILDKTYASPLIMAHLLYYMKT